MVLAIVSGLLQWIIIYFGDLGLTSDGVAYIKLAESVGTGSPFIVDNVLVTQWPPLYPIIIWCVSQVLNVETFVAMKVWAVLLSIGMSLVLVSFVPKSNRKVQILLAILFWGVATSVYFRCALSESTFVFLLLSSFIAFKNIKETSSYSQFALVGFIASLMTLTRFAGIGIFAGIALFYLIKERNLKNVFVMGISFIIPLVPWFLYIHSLDYPVAVRPFEVHIVSLDHIKGLAGSIYTFLKPISIIVVVPVIAASFIGITYLSNVKSRLFSKIDESSLYPTVILVYLLFLTLIICFLDFAVSYNSRLLIPCYVTFIIWISIEFTSLDFGKKMPKVIFILLIIGYSLGVFEQSTDHMQNGFRYTSDTWKNSETKDYILDNHSVFYYSNAATVLKYYGADSISRIPIKISPKTDKMVADAEQQLESLVNKVKSGTCEIAILDNKKYYKKYFSITDIENRMGDKLSKRTFNDGVIYYYIKK